MWHFEFCLNIAEFGLVRAVSEWMVNLLLLEFHKTAQPVSPVLALVQTFRNQATGCSKSKQTHKQTNTLLPPKKN